MEEPIYEVVDGELEVDEVAEMYTLYQMGCTLAEIGIEYEVSHQTVATRFRERGWDLRPKGGGNKTRCKQGHSLTEENVYWVLQADGNRNRKCRICRLAWQKKRRDRKREERLAASAK